jgi:anaerobic selenocysteine-containing dehydrogenase
VTALTENLVRTREVCAADFTSADPDLTDLSENVGFHYSVCQMCHGRCGLRAKVAGGTVLKLGGSTSFYDTWVQVQKI